MSKGRIDRALIIGANGGFGRAFSRRLGDSGVQIISADTRGAVDVCADVVASPEDIFPHLDADLVLLCIPQESAMPLLEAIGDRVASETLVVDICSVKTPICTLAERAVTSSEYLSLHPMFAPTREFAGANAVAIDVRPGARSERFKTLLREWGLSLIETDAEGHDRVTSLVQVVTHATLASFANARHRMDIDEALLAAFATPNYAELDSLSQKMLGETASLYHNMQTENPFASAAHEAMREALSQTLDAFSSRDATEAMFTRFKRTDDGSDQ